MIRYEWKKLLIGRKGWLLILLLILAELAGTLLFTRPYDKVLEDNRAVYEVYLSKVEGPLTAQKREYLESEMERLNSVHQELEQLKQDYYSGEISEEAYREVFDRLSQEDGAYTGFSKLYSQYIFVRESENRSFLYTGGWETLLTDQEPDYLFLLALILLLTPIFCEEYACRMQDILLTQKRSANNQVAAKLTVALTLTLALTALFQIFDLIYCSARFGLPNGSFTLQSLRSFGNTAKELNLWQAFWFQFALKAVGYVYAALLIVGLSVLLKQFALTLMASVGILLLPFLTVEDPSAFLRIPGPWALTIGSIYLNGGPEELHGLELAGLLLGVTVMAGVLLCILRRRNANWHLKKLLICLVCLLLTGCTDTQGELVWNRSTSGQYETEAYLLTTGYEGATLTNKESGQVYAFPVNPLEGEILTCGSSLYGVGDLVYYIRTTTHHPNAGWDSVTTDRDLVKLNLSTMEETVVYQWNEEAKWFFGVLDRPAAEANSFAAELQFLHGNAMYYVDSNLSSLNRMDLVTGQCETVLPVLNTQEIAYDGRNLYYLDSYNRLVIRDLETGGEQVVEAVVAGAFTLTAEGVRFENLRDQGSEYTWNRQAGTVVKP